MKTKIIIFSLALVIVAIVGGCKKNNEPAKNGSVVFASTTNRGDCRATINGQTVYWDYLLDSAPACGAGTHSATVVLPVGTYTFTAQCDNGFGWDSGNIQDYDGQNSVTITENGCAVVWW